MLGVGSCGASTSGAFPKQSPCVVSRQPHDQRFRRPYRLLMCRLFSPLSLEDVVCTISRVFSNGRQSLQTQVEAVEYNLDP